MNKTIYSFTCLFSVISLMFGGYSTANARSSVLPSTPALPPVSMQAQSGNTYYVATTGNDANPGTQALPWKTIQKAADTVSAGSAVTVLAGNYPERVTVTRSGINFGASGAVVMQGFAITADNITVNGFEIADTTGVGIDYVGKGSVFENNYIHGAAKGGILINVLPGNETATSDNIVRNNRIYRTGMNGVTVTGRNSLVERNEIWGIIQYPPNWINPPSWADADGIHFHGSGHIIRGNYIHDILYSDPLNVTPHIDCFQTFYASPYKEAASNIIIEQNFCDNAQAETNNRAGQGFMLQNATNITIRNNIIRAYVGVGATQASTGLSILNNTFVNNLALATTYNPVGITINSSKSELKNNIFYDTLGHMVYGAPADLVSGNNINYRSDGKELWTTNTYSHINDLWGVSPLLSTDGRLQAGSPAIDAGAIVPVTNDFYGNSRPLGAGYDIGACEHNPSGNLLPPVVTASDGTSLGKVQITWTAVSGATSYLVYRSGSPDGVKIPVNGYSTTALGGDDIWATAGVTYYYWVKACNASGCSNLNTIETGWRGLTPPVVTASDGTKPDKVQVTWPAVSGATSYVAYRSETPTGVKIPTTGLVTSALGGDDLWAVHGVTYYYWVKACNGSNCSALSANETGWR